MRLLSSLDDKNPPCEETEFTPLHGAAKYGHFDVCQLILEHAENKNPVDCGGKTPFQYAKSEGHPDVAQLFQRYQSPNAAHHHRSSKKKRTQRRKK